MSTAFTCISFHQVCSANLCSFSAHILVGSGHLVGSNQLLLRLLNEFCLLLQNLNILMIGAQNGKGGFFPKGIQGKINKPVGFDKLAEATEDWTGLREASQVPPITHILCDMTLCWRMNA